MQQPNQIRFSSNMRKLARALAIAFILASLVLPLIAWPMTAAAAGLPAVTTAASAPTGVTTTGATVNEECTATGGANVTAWGTYYGLTTSYGSAVNNAGVHAAPFTWSDPIAGLSAATLYHYQAYATNATGTDTGPDYTFLTLPGAPTDANIAAGDEEVTVSWTQATGETSPMATAMETRVQYSSAGYPATYDAGTTGIDWTSESVGVITGLTNGTTYFVAIFSRAHNGGLTSYSTASAHVTTAPSATAASTNTGCYIPLTITNSGASPVTGRFQYTVPASTLISMGLMDAQGDDVRFEDETLSGKQTSTIGELANSSAYWYTPILTIPANHSSTYGVWMSNPGSTARSQVWVSASTDTSSIADNAGLQIQTNLTITDKVYLPTLPGATQHIIFKDGSYKLDVTATDFVFGVCIAAAWHSVSATATAATWQTISANYDGVNLSISINGGAPVTLPQGGNIDQNTNNVVMNAFNGYSYDTVILSGATTEVQLDFTPPQITGTAGTITVADQSGLSNNMTTTMTGNPASTATQTGALNCPYGTTLSDVDTSGSNTYMPTSTQDMTTGGLSNRGANVSSGSVPGSLISAVADATDISTYWLWMWVAIVGAVVFYLIPIKLLAGHGDYGANLLIGAGCSFIWMCLLVAWQVIPFWMLFIQALFALGPAVWRNRGTGI